MDSSSIRQMLLKQRRSLSFAEQQHASFLITEQAKKTPAFKTSQYIAFYYPVNGEVDCKPLIKYAWEQNKIVFLPILANQKLQFVRYLPDQLLVKNHYGIEEPIVTPENKIYAAHLDLVYAPLVAFDIQLNRIGMGKGYYDRTFHFLKTSQSKPLLVGLAYDFQKTPTFQPNVWDIPLNQVITEKQIYD